jgi:sodium-independent sulfate anion transporter 11
LLQPVAVLSTVTGNIVLEVAKKLPNVPGHIIASDIAIIGGSIVCFLGLARLGFIVDFISLTAITAFITGSAINIAVAQVPTLMGITGFSTRAPTYQVIINILKHLGRTKLDAAMGLTALLLLYLIRITCNRLAKRYPSQRKTYFFISTLRTAFVILLYTMISWLVNRNHRKTPKFAILSTVPRGFKYAAVPTINKEIISAFSDKLPAVVIVMLIEHISIAKSFGRVNHYIINPSQELVAMGVTNLLGPFLGAYPATGSFSRTAIKSKSGVRTPVAGVITAIVVLLAIYALPAVFFYIPNASLSAIIIHAVGDLIAPPNTVYHIWRISPIEVPIFFAGVIVTVFSSIENGVYTTICVSAGLLLYRIVKAHGRFLGKVQIHSVMGDHILNDDEPKITEKYGITKTSKLNSNVNPSFDDRTAVRNAFLPIDRRDGSNPAIEFETPYPGIFIYRFSEGYNYPNASHYLDNLISTIYKETQRTNPATYGKPGVSLPFKFLFSISGIQH